jgi:hypothetical protein
VAVRTADNVARQVDLSYRAYVEFQVTKFLNSRLEVTKWKTDDLGKVGVGSP